MTDPRSWSKVQSEFGKNPRVIYVAGCTQHFDCLGGGGAFICSNLDGLLSYQTGEKNKIKFKKVSHKKAITRLSLILFFS